MNLCVPVLEHLHGAGVCNLGYTATGLRHRRLPAKVGRTLRDDWGDEHVERFRFERAGATLDGTASFLGADRAIDDVSWEDGQLRFITRSRATMGDETRDITHRYRFARACGRLKVTQVAQGGFSPELPRVFYAEAARPQP